MPSTPVSAALQQLLQMQRRDYQERRVQYDRERQVQQTHWSQRTQWERDRQRREQQQLDATQKGQRLSLGRRREHSLRSLEDSARQHERHLQQQHRRDRDMLRRSQQQSQSRLQSRHQVQEKALLGLAKQVGYGGAGLRAALLSPAGQAVAGQLNPKQEQAIHRWAQAGMSTPEIMSRFKRLNSKEEERQSNRSRTHLLSQREGQEKQLDAVRNFNRQSLEQQKQHFEKQDRQLEKQHRQQQASQRQRHTKERSQLAEERRGQQQSQYQKYRADVYAKRVRYSDERFDVHEEERQERQTEKKRRQEAAGLRALPGQAIRTVQVATRIGRAIQSPFMSQERQIIEFGHALGQLGGKIGVFGEAIAALVEFKNVIDGTTLAVMKLGLNMPMIRLVEQQEQQKQSFVHVSQYALAQQRERGESLRGVRLPGGGTTGAEAIGELGKSLVGLAGNRNTYKGELEYRRAQLRFTARVGVQHAAAELEAAQEARKVAQKRVEEGKAQAPGYEEYAAFARRRLAAAYGRQTGVPGTDRAFGNQKEIAEAIEEKYRAEQTALAANKQLQEDINRLNEADVAVAQRRLALERAKLGQLKAEQQILAQKERTMSTAAQSLGAMHPAQRAMALQSLRMAMNMKDIGLLPDFMKQKVQQIAPELFAKLAEQSGLRTAGYKEVLKAAGLDKEDLANVRKRQAEIEAKVSVQFSINEAKFSEAIADAIEKKFNNMLKVIEAKIKLEQEALRTGQMAQHAMQ